MSENTKIEWCDHTQNFWIGCSKVSPACDSCYAEVSTPSRTMKVGWGPGVPRHRTAPSTWAMPKKWNDHHAVFFAKHGRRQRVFALSLGDWLDNEVPIGWLVDMLEVIRTTPNLDWLLLSKRIGMWRKRLLEAISSKGGVSQELATWIADWLDGNPPANVWVGATICNQEEADRDLPKLERVPAARHFVSIEPMLGQIDLQLMQYHDSDHHDEAGRIIANTRRRWLRLVIVGGESGPGARECHVSHIRGVVQQCQAAGVSVFVKQLGAQPRGWCAASVHICPKEAAELDADYCDFYEAGECGAPCRGRCVVFVDKKGGDMAEWPEDLRVREFPS